MGAPGRLPEPFRDRFLCSFALRFSHGFEDNAGEAHDEEDHAGAAHHGEDHAREPPYYDREDHVGEARKKANHA